jgi:uncharacterized membrane protein
LWNSTINLYRYYQQIVKPIARIHVIIQSTAIEWKNDMAQQNTNDILVIIFPSRKILVRALQHLNTNDNIDIQRAAIVAKAGDGETIILDDDLSADEGGIAGGTLGAAMAAFGMLQLGALALPGIGAVIAIGGGALVGALLGQVTGRFAANLLDFGFRNEQIENLSQELTAGHPALVLGLDNRKKLQPLIEKELRDYQAELIAPMRPTGQIKRPSA